MIYVGENIQKIQAGGDIVNLRNIKILKKIYNSKFNIIHISCKSTIQTFINLLLGCMNGLTPLIIFRIIYNIKKHKEDNIFLTSSKLGLLAYCIKKLIPETNIWVFFHNIEKQYTAEEYRVNRTLKNWFISKISSFNEKLSCKYGDILIVLNNRDKNLLNQYYKKEANIILPISFEDKYSVEIHETTPKEKKNFNLLFVGSAFYANIEALNWFINKILPKLSNCILTIVGSGMDRYYNSSDKVKVYGYVEDISIYYYKCDLVISPILSGGGMKTKTAEALMYGCPIIGTNEAFEGYDIEISKIGACCNCEYEIIKAINFFQNDHNALKICASNARHFFQKSYTIESSLNIIRNFLGK